MSCEPQIKMKTTTKLTRRISTPLFSIAIIALLPACIVEDGPYYGRRHVVVRGPGVYAALPSGYAGSYYSHQGRYYYGGRHEDGRFQSDGQYYNHRYTHDGRYYYGGQYYQGRD